MRKSQVQLDCPQCNLALPPNLLVTRVKTLAFPDVAVDFVELLKLAQ